MTSSAVVVAAFRRLCFLCLCLAPTSSVVSGFAPPTRRAHRGTPPPTALFATDVADAPPRPSEPTSASSSSPPAASSESPALRAALQSLASTTLALLSGNEEAAASLAGGAARKKHVIRRVFEEYDVCGSGTLSVDEARALFADLARSMVLELSKGGGAAGEEGGEADGGKGGTEEREVKVAQAHARRVLADDEVGNTIDRVAGKLLLMADADGDGRVNLPELAQLFETVFEANLGAPAGGNDGDDDDDGVLENRNERTERRRRRVPSGTFPQPLRALAGSLQLLPPRERALATEAAGRSALWNVGVPGDDHTLRRVVLENGGGDNDAEGKTKGGKKGSSSNALSLIGLGRSADASAYFLPELGIALDAGLHVSSLRPRTVLLTHGHRDHIGALPVHAGNGALLIVPEPIRELVRNFLVAEAQLNYGERTSEEATLEALGGLDDDALVGAADGMRLLLPKDKYSGSPTPVGVHVLTAPHKEGVPACSYGIFRRKKRLKEEYRGMSKSALGALLRTKRAEGEEAPAITENYDEGILFYTGDTTIALLRERWREICGEYRHVIHEVTFLGPPSSDLDSSVRRKGHTHYAQLHPWICAFPSTTFILVHWSLRYEREEVLDFFRRNYGGVPKNVVLWL